MDKTRILLASLLKPVNEPRMFEKIGKSLTKLSDAEVHICGYRNTAPLPGFPDLFFHPLFSFRRLSVGRLLAQFTYLKFLFRLKPEIIVAATHELLPATILYKVFSGSTVVYDVQENYFSNLMHQRVYPSGIRQTMAYLVRLFEWLTSPFIKHFLLAEKNYALQLPFLKGRYTIIENKYKGANGQVYTDFKVPVKVNSENLKLLYTGTISEEYGIFEAIQLASAFNRINPGVTLTIIGYCAKDETYQKLLHYIKDKRYITLTGGKNPVPYPEILKAIQTHQAGLVPYQPNESTFTCIPTKIYEYLANRLPMLVQENPNWTELVNSHQGGIFLNYSNPQPEMVYNQLMHTTFYNKGNPEDVFWESEEHKLKPLFSSLIKKTT